MTARAKMTYKEALAEHRQLQRRVEGLAEYLDRPRPELTEEEAHGWAEGLARRLLELHDKLSLHFAREEESGFLRETHEAFPRAAHTAKTLAREHQKMLRELRAILPEAMRYAEFKASRGTGLRRRTRALVDFFTDHEARETELFELLHLQDLGPGD